MGPKKTSKRLSVCLFFSAPEALVQSVLPKYANVLLSCFEERLNRPLKSRIFSKSSDCFAAQIEEHHCKISIPSVSHEPIVKLLQDYYNNFYTLRKSFSRDKDKFKFKTKTLLMKQSPNFLMLLPASV